MIAAARPGAIALGVDHDHYRHAIIRCIGDLEPRSQPGPLRDARAALFADDENSDRRCSRGLLESARFLLSAASAEDPDEPVVYRSGHRSPERPRARPAPPGMYTDTSRPEPPRPRSHRQQRRRGARRPLQPHRRDRPQGRLARGRRRRPRHAGRHPPEGEGQRRRADPHAAARGRQVLGRRATSSPAACTASACRWSTRCRSTSSAGCAAAARNTTSPSRTAKVASKLEVVGKVGQSNTGTTVRFWPDPKFFDSRRDLGPEAQARAEGQGRAVPGAAHALHDEKTGEKEEWLYTDGLAQYLRESARAARDGCPTSRSPARSRASTRASTGPSLWRADGGALVDGELRQPDPDAAGRHARQRLPRRPRPRRCASSASSATSCRAASSSRPRTSGTTRATCCR